MKTWFQKYKFKIISKWQWFKNRVQYLYQSHLQNVLYQNIIMNNIQQVWFKPNQDDENTSDLMNKNSRDVIKVNLIPALNVWPTTHHFSSSLEGFCGKPKTDAIKHLICNCNITKSFWTCSNLLNWALENKQLRSYAILLSSKKTSV